MAWANFGMNMLQQLGTNLSDRIGTGASLRHQKMREQVKQTQAEAAAGIIGRVEGAKAAGIHPLVAMGSNVGGATLPVGNSFNSSGDFGFAAAAMQRRELAARREELEIQKQQEATRAQSQAKMDALEAEEKRARIALTNAQTAAQQKQMADSDRDFLASQRQLARQQSQHSVPLRVSNRSGPKDMFVPVKDRYGKIQYIPNPDIYDLELPETVGAGTLVVPELERGKQGNILQQFKRWWNGRNYQKESEKWGRKKPSTPSGMFRSFP